jgi:hypothetical protein
MGQVYQRIDGQLRDFIERQPVFFYCAAKPHNAASLDGLPALPLPLPALPVPAR